MRFLVYILIYGLVLFNFPSCLSSDISDAGVKTEDVSSFIDNLKKENSDALKKGALASLGQKVEELANGTIIDEEQIKVALKAELDELSKTSPNIKKEEDNLIQASAEYITKKQSKVTPPTTGGRADPTTTTANDTGGSSDSSTPVATGSGEDNTDNTTGGSGGSGGST